MKGSQKNHDRKHQQSLEVQNYQNWRTPSRSREKRTAARNRIHLYFKVEGMEHRTMKHQHLVENS